MEKLIIVPGICSILIKGSMYYNLISAAISEASRNIGKTAIASQTKAIYDCNGPSWSHGISENSAKSTAKINIFPGVIISKDESDRLFQYGHAYDLADVSFKNEVKSCYYGGGINISIEE